MAYNGKAEATMAWEKMSIDEIAVAVAKTSDEVIKEATKGFWADLALDVKEVEQVLATLDATTMAAWFDAMSFQGFNVTTLYGEIKKIYNKYLTTAKGVALTAREMFLKDLMYLLLVYAIRGTKLASIQNKSDTGLKTTMTNLVGVWDIKDTGPGQNLKPTDITLARLAALFPHLVLRIRAIGLGAGKMPTLGETPTNFPKELAFAAAASLIPPIKTFDPLFEKFLTWSKNFDKVIHTKDKKESSDETLRNFANLARNSPVLSTGARIVMLQTFCSFSIKEMCT